MWLTVALLQENVSDKLLKRHLLVLRGRKSFRFGSPWCQVSRGPLYFLPIGLSRLPAWTCSPAQPSAVPAITIKLFFFLSPLPDPLVRM